MRVRTVLGSTILAVACGCASSSPTVESGSDFDSFNGARVEVRAEGGFAALSIGQTIDHDTRAFSYSQRRMCGTSCPAPMDSASGTLSPAVNDSIFNVILQDARTLSRDDYGTTKNAADMMTHTIRLTANDRVRTIRGDDGTLPDAARHIVNTVREAISAARSRD
jgi:hypothetical protein